MKTSAQSGWAITPGSLRPVHRSVAVHSDRPPGPAARHVVAHAVDRPGHRPEVQHVITGRAHQIHGSRGILTQPHRPSIRFEDHRHAFVQLTHGGVGAGGQDGEGPQQASVWRLPPLPHAGKNHGRTVLPGNRIRLLPVGSGLPLIERVRRHQTAPLGECVLEHAGGGGRLRPGVDRLRAGRLQILGPGWDQPPAQ